MIETCLHKPTLEWVLKRIKGYSNDEYYDYCSALSQLEADLEGLLKECEEA